MKKIFFSAVSLVFLVAGSVQAQYEFYPSDFGRQLFNGGTARYMGIGGAGTSLGADLSAAYVNPAGLGMYRKSEFSFSPMFGVSGSNTSYIGETEHDSKGSFGISNLGIAICSNKDELDNSAWRGGTFSIGMNKTNSFHNRISFTGTDNASMADYFAQLGTGIPSSTLDAQSPDDPTGSGISTLPGLAYWTYLINPDSTGSNYYDGLTNESLQKEATYTTKGSQATWNISYGGNYKDKLFIGGALGITSINYREDLSYTETNLDSQAPSDIFQTFTYNDYNKVKGTGVNFKLGYIYKASDVVRFGSTITTPTYYWMNQEYSSDLTVTFPYYVTNQNGDVLGTQYQTTSPGYFKFNYTTPLKFSSGISLFAGKAGFISADFEYIPYQLSDLSGRSSADDKFLKPYNKKITSSYKNVLNLRVGGELRLDIFRLRAGLAYLPTPYNYTDKVNKDIAQVSLGAGVRLDDVYFDIGLVDSRFASSYTPYTLPYNYSNVPSGSTATSKNSMVNVVLTMGFYFE